MPCTIESTTLKMEKLMRGHQGNATKHATRRAKLKNGNATERATTKVELENGNATELCHYKG